MPATVSLVRIQDQLDFSGSLTSGYFLKWNGSAFVLDAVSPGGSDTQVQFNDGGSFGGDSGLTWDKTSNSLVLTSSHSAALAVGPGGNTNPVLRVVTNVASQATGLSVTGNAAGSGVTLTVLSSGTNEDLRLVPKGSGGLIIGAGAGVASFSSTGILTAPSVSVTQVAMGLSAVNWDAGTGAINVAMQNAAGADFGVSVGNAGSKVYLRGVASQSAPLLQLQGQSSTTAGRPQADIDTAWVDSTDATRKARAVRRAWDTAARETDRGWADGSAGRFAAACPASAPTDAHLAASQVSFYVDEGGNNLTFRVCYADGTTYKSGTVALT